MKLQMCRTVETTNKNESVLLATVCCDICMYTYVNIKHRHLRDRPKNRKISE